MRLFTLLLVFLLAAYTSVLAQKKVAGSINGNLRDSASNLPLEAATVSVIDLADSSLVSYTLSDAKGNFQIKALPTQQQLKLAISFNGYKSVERRFFLATATKDLKTDSFLLVKDYAQLEEVVVMAERPPVLFKKDTVEFNAGSFKTKPNAVVEDLLKQLPGVDVDKDGNITINGKPVSKITVDGKEFFSGDLKIATKNLPKDIVDKIQVSDNRSKEAIFNNTTTGNEDKAINITLKKDKKKGWFGRATVGYGSSGRYESNANVNYYKGKNQLSFIGNLNNTNRSGSGNNESRNNAGGGGGGGGITESGSAGINFSAEPAKGFRLSGSYFYNEGSTINNQRRRRENILPDTSFFYVANNNRTGNNTSHNVALHGNVDFDTLTQMNFNVNFNARDGRSLSANNSYSEDLEGNLINSSITDYLSNNNGQGLNSNVFISRKLKKKGRGISLSLGLNQNNSDGINDNIGINTFSITGSMQVDTLNQRSLDDNNGRSFNASFTYNEPLSKTLNLILRAGYSHSLNNSERITNNLNGVTGKYDLADSTLSNSFRNTNRSLNPGITLNYRNQKIWGNIGNSVNFLRQDNYSLTTDSLLRQFYVNFFPTANFGYHLTKTHDVNFNYNGSTQQPSVQQLQPVADNSNPLYIRLGNPDLQPSFTHRLGLNLQSQSPQGKGYLFSGVNYNTTSNQIVQEVYYDSAGRQISRPINTDGNYGGSVYVNLGKNWKKKGRSARLNFNTNLNLNRSTMFSNRIKNRANSYGVSQGVSGNVQVDNKFDISPRYMIRFSDTKYSIEQNGQIASSITQNIAIDINIYITKRFTIETDINTNYNNRIAPGFRKSVTSWTAAANIKLFKKEEGNLRFIIYDLLKQNTSVSRYISSTYIEDVQQDVLQQYFLLSFTYNLRKF